MGVKNFKRFFISIPKCVGLNSESKPKPKLILVWVWAPTRDPNPFSTHTLFLSFDACCLYLWVLLSWRKCRVRSRCRGRPCLWSCSRCCWPWPRPFSSCSIWGWSRWRRAWRPRLAGSRAATTWLARSAFSWPSRRHCCCWSLSRSRWFRSRSN